MPHLTQKKGMLMKSTHNTPTALRNFRGNYILCTSVKLSTSGRPKKEQITAILDSSILDNLNF